MIGACIDDTGFALLLGVKSDSSYAQLAPGFLLIPLGMGLGVPAMTTAVLASAEKRISATASAVLNTARQAAGAVGVAALGAWAHGGGESTARAVHNGALVSIALIAAALALALRVDRRAASAHR
jgi:DHA2 family methylenomycin A resistance protein-like MFS transporter